MRKQRCDSNWKQLSRQQRETMDNWLFNDHLGYDETLTRVKSEFRVCASRTSLCKYYQRRLHERQATDLVEAQAMADTVAGPEADTDAMRKAAIKLIAKTALKIAFERPDRLKELESLTKLLLLNEDIEIRRRRVKLGYDQFHYKAASAASEELPKLAALISEIDEDEDLTEEQKEEKVHDLLYPDDARLGLHKFEDSEAAEEPDEDEEEDDEPEEEADESEDDTETADDEPASEPAAPEQSAVEEMPPNDESVPSAPAPAEEPKPQPEDDPETKELNRIIILAENGDPNSAYLLGLRYRDGFGVPRDLVKAREWLDKAASQGIAPARLALQILRLKYGDDVLQGVQ